MKVVPVTIFVFAIYMISLITMSTSLRIRDSVQTQTRIECALHKDNKAAQKICNKWTYR